MTTPGRSFQDFRGLQEHPVVSTSMTFLDRCLDNSFNQHHPRRSHVRMTLWISLLDVATGGRRTVSLGTQAGVSAVEIDIPLGINDGDNVQYEGIGPGGADLVVQFRVSPDRTLATQWIEPHTRSSN
jgi:hypothetical protein